MSPAPPSNVHTTLYRLDRAGATAIKRIPERTDIGVFLYYEWGFVGVITPDLGVGVTHAVRPNCELHYPPDDPTTVYLRSKREITSGRLTIDFRLAPWWVWPPPLPLALSPHLLAAPAHKVGRSAIHGNGALVAQPVCRGAYLGVCIAIHWLLFPVITREFGRYINHSSTPSCRLEWAGWRTGWEVVSLRALATNEEITLDYGHLPWYCRGPPPHE